MKVWMRTVMKAHREEERWGEEGAGETAVSSRRGSYRPVLFWHGWIQHSRKSKSIGEIFGRTGVDREIIVKNAGNSQSVAPRVILVTKCVQLVFKCLGTKLWVWTLAENRHVRRTWETISPGWSASLDFKIRQTFSGNTACNGLHQNTFS